MAEQIDQLIGVLGYVLSGDNTKIQEATKFLKSFTKKVESVGLLTYIMANNASPQLRQLSAVLVKRHMVKLYSQLDAGAANQLKSLLLQRFFTEEVNIIRTNIGQLIGVIAQQVLGQNTWPELYAILSAQTQSGQDLQTRQRGLLLLSLIFDYSGDALKPFYSNFYGFFVTNLQDSDKQIRVQTVKCLISLFDNIQHMEKKEAQQYKTLVEPILSFVDQCLKEGDEDNAYHCFDAFSYLAESKLTILDKHLGLIIQYAAGPNILLNPKCSHRFKECVIDFIYAVVESHRKVLQGNAPLMKQVVETISLLIAQPINTRDYEADEDPIQDVALWMVEILCVSIKKKKPLYALFLETISQLVLSNDGNRMNAGFLILAAIAEGLADQVRRNLANPIMNVLLPKGLEDERPEVRGAAIKALTYFSEWLIPEFLIYDSIVIPHMVKNLIAVDPRIREKVLLTLDVFAENMEEDKIKPYLRTLLPALVQVFLDHQTTFYARRLCLSSIGSIVTSSRQGFTVYLPDVSTLLLKVLDEKDTPEIMGIKAEAIQCLGRIAEAFPDSVVQSQLITPLSSKVYQLLTLHNDFEIREACLSFFYNQASAQKEQFAPVFLQIIDFTISLAKSTEGITYEKKKKEGGDFSLDTDSEDDEETTGNNNMRVKLTQLDEKAAAIHALGEFAASVPMNFGPYFKPVSSIFEETVDYFYENVRIQTVSAYAGLIEGTVKYQNNGTIPAFQPGLPCVTRFNPEVEAMIQTDFMMKLVGVLLNDDSWESVVAALEAIQQSMKKLGPAVIDGNLTQLTEAIKTLLDRKARCFGVDDDDEEIEQEEEEEDDEDTNENVFEALTDIIPQLAKTLKLGFLVPFQNILPSLLAYCNPERDVNDNIQALGCLAQLFESVPTTIQYCFQQVGPILLQAPEIRDLELNRNTAFCLSNFIEFGEASLVEQTIPNILVTLKTIFDDSTAYQPAIDNAAAALCKIMVRFPHTVPLQQALERVFVLLPFKGDQEEEFTALSMLLHLGNTQPALISPHMELVVKLLLDGVQQRELYKIKDEKLGTLTGALRGLAGQYKGLIESYVLSIPDESQRNAVIALLQ